MDESFQEKLKKDTLEAAVKAVREKIDSLRCSVHGQAPQLKFSEDSGSGEQKMSFDCCCDVLAGMLQKVLQD
jgi:hypothetical protein